jgi:hypothetical protein
VSTSILQSPTELSGAATKSYITSEGFLILDASKIIVRSLYNCRVFGYYGGIQKLTALMKGILIFLVPDFYYSCASFRYNCRFFSLWKLV